MRRVHRPSHPHPRNTMHAVPTGLVKCLSSGQTFDLQSLTTVDHRSKRVPASPSAHTVMLSRTPDDPAWRPGPAGYRAPASRRRPSRRNGLWAGWRHRRLGWRGREGGVTDARGQVRGGNKENLCVYPSIACISAEKRTRVSTRGELYLSVCLHILSIYQYFKSYQ